MSVLVNVVVIGGSGNIGSIILRHLLQHPTLHVTVLTRQSSTASFPGECEIVRSDFTEASLIKAFAGQDAVVSVVGATALADQKKYIDAAVKAGVKRFLPSEFGIDSFSKKSAEILPLLAAKVDVIEYLRSKEADGLTWTALVTGLLLDWCLRYNFLGFDIAAKTATIWDNGSTRFSVTNEDDLGKAVTAILHKPNETANKILHLQSVCTTQAEILKALEVQSGTWKKEHVQTKDMIALGQKKMGEGSIEGAFILVKALGYGDVPGAKSNFEDGQLANEVLGIPMANVAETVGRVLHA